jgi:hypothetical protein
MALVFTGAAGLFTRLGKLALIVKDFNTHQATKLGPDIDGAVAQYATPILLPVATLEPAKLAARQGAGNLFPIVRQAAADTVLAMVLADAPTKAGSLSAALAEVIRQMSAAAASVKQCAVTAVAAAVTPFNGNGSVVLSTKRGDGLVNENVVAETGVLLCTADSQTGGATLGQETFTYAGAADQGDPSLDDWPTGSGGSATLNACDATLDNSGGNILTNSCMELFTANLPNQWAALAGVAGTDFLKETTAAKVYSGTASLKIVGGGTAPSLAQTFNSASGTAGVLTPQTSYAVNFAAIVDVVPAAGVLTFDLTDSLGNVLNDAQGNACSFTVAVTTMTTSFAMYSGVLRAPRAFPSGTTTYRLRMRVSTGISGGSNLWIDHLAMKDLTSLYAGGPGAAVFSGSTKFVAGDGWNIAQTNDRGGASYCATFQAVFDKFFGTRALGLLLPSNGAPTISDGLIA